MVQQVLSNGAPNVPWFTAEDPAAIARQMFQRVGFRVDYLELEEDRFCFKEQEARGWSSGLCAVFSLKKRPGSMFATSVKEKLVHQVQPIHGSASRLP